MGMIGGLYLAVTSKMFPKMLYCMKRPPWLIVAGIFSIPAATGGCWGGGSDWGGGAAASDITVSECWASIFQTLENIDFPDFNRKFFLCVVLGVGWGGVGWGVRSTNLWILQNLGGTNQTLVYCCWFSFHILFFNIRGNRFGCLFYFF